MSKSNLKKFFLPFLIIVFSIGISLIVKADLPPGGVDLGTSDNFAILSGSGITDATHLGTIAGDVGTHPITGAAITGFSCTQMSFGSTLYDNNAGYTGGFDANTACRITNGGLLTLAKSALATAYADASTRPQSGADIPTDLATQILSPGVYHALSGTFAISGAGTLTLDGGGDPNAVFIFKADTTLVTGGASSVVLTNGAQACNVFWAVGSSATLDNTTFAGTIMAVGSIGDAGDSTVNGRLLADADDNGTGAVTLINTDVTVPSCAPSLTLLKVVDNTGGGTALDTAWTLIATGTGGSPTNLSGTTPVDSNVTFNDATFGADTYTLAESFGPANYDASNWSCVTNGGGPVISNSITLGAGDDAICTITNTYNPPPVHSGGSSGSSRRITPATLHIIKQVVNNNGGTLIASSFNLHVKSSGTDVVGSPQFGIGVPGTSYTLPAGTYVVSEDAANGSYVQSFSGACDQNGNVILSAGDDLTCVITNDDIASGFVNPVPSLPKTGFPPKENSMLLIMILAGLSLIGTSIYFARKNKSAI